MHSSYLMKIRQPLTNTASPTVRYPLAGLASYLSLCISLMTLIGLSVVVSKMDKSPTADSIAVSTLGTQTVRGTVLMISDELCVVRNAKGNGMLLQLSQDTKISGRMSVGDRIEAQVTSDSRALSIRKLT